MTEIVRGDRGEIPVLRLVGEVGTEQAASLEAALAEAFRSTGGPIVLDLRATLHLHYRVAGLLVRAARRGRRMALLGPTPYVRQILRLAGAVEADLTEVWDSEAA